ncbi:hypothetical protein [Maricaulis parjimensis]|uniref:hypothetical protein n=1 Tax=Maricaulis parjimensis TaxID=144023 RepID=UPI00193A0261|nr:hypothetical protein [Maricaulis parjimensis]
MGQGEWSLDAERRLAEITFRPQQTLLELRDDIAALPDVDGWDPDFDVIFIIPDNAALDTFTPENLAAHQEFMRGWNAEHRNGDAPKTALVCSNDLKRVIPHLWEAMNRQNWKTSIGVFPTRQEALAWLGKTR